MSWSKIETKTKKPLGWWYHKICCEWEYFYFGPEKGYYFHLNKMVNKYKIDLYGKPC